MRYSCLKSAAHDSQENFQDLPDDREAPTPSDDEPEDHPTLTDRVRATPTPKPSSIPPLWNDGGLPVKEEVLENDRVFGLAMDPVEQKCLFGLDKKIEACNAEIEKARAEIEKASAAKTRTEVAEAQDPPSAALEEEKAARRQWIEARMKELREKMDLKQRPGLFSEMA